MKQRFSALDLRCSLPALAPLLGGRLANIYDLGPRTFLLKLTPPASKHRLLSAALEKDVVDDEVQAVDAELEAAGAQEDEAEKDEERREERFEESHEDRDEDGSKQSAKESYLATGPAAKAFLLIESGVRLHLTDYAREKTNSPNAFTMKLRKHLRSRKLMKISQLGTDRVVDLQFGESYHLILEFYAAGNVILTDAKYSILALLRVIDQDIVPSTVTMNPNPLAVPPVIAIPSVENSSNVAAPTTTTTPTTATETTSAPVTQKFVVGEIYNIHMAQQFAPMTMDTLRSIFFPATLSTENTVIMESAYVIESAEPTKDDSNLAPFKPAWSKKKAAFASKTPNQKRPQLKRFLREKFAFTYSAPLVDHCFHVSGLDPEKKVSDVTDQDLDSLLNAFRRCDTIILEAETRIMPGYLILKDEAYHEFHPYRFAQFSDLNDSEIREFPTFSHAADDFFSNLEAQKLQAKGKQLEANAAKKLSSSDRSR